MGIHPILGILLERRNWPGQGGKQIGVQTVLWLIAYQQGLGLRTSWGCAQESVTEDPIGEFACIKTVS